MESHWPAGGHIEETKAVILAIDDEPNVCDLIKQVLADHEVVTAFDGPEGLEKARQLVPDLILLYVMMPTMSGFEVCRRLRASQVLGEIPVIFLTGRGSLSDKVSGFEAGADDYVVKPFHLRELEMRVQAVLRRGRPHEKVDLLQIGGISLDLRSRDASAGERSATLTPTEFALLEYLMRRPGEILPSHRLLEDVWNYPPRVGDVALVRMHIRNLREKLEENPGEPRLIVTVGRQGYRIRG